MARRDQEGLPDRWSPKNIKAMLYGSAALLIAAQYKEETLEYLPETILGFRYLDSSRHVLPAIGITLFTQFYTNTAIGDAPRPLSWVPSLRSAFTKLSGVALDYERTSSAVIGFIPSVGYELQQYARGGQIGLGDLVLAGVSGAVAVRFSTCEAAPVESQTFEDELMFDLTQELVIEHITE